MRWLILLLVLCASPAEATIYWATSFELCHPQSTPRPTPVDTNYWSSRSGEPYITTANVATLPGGTNRCAMRFDVPSGTATTLVPAITAISAGVTPLNATMDLRVGTGAPTTWREILAFGDSTATGHYTRGCILAERYTTTIAGVRYYSLGVFYGDTTSLVCSGSTQNGRRCTTASDCPAAGNPLEPQCLVATLASAPAAAEGTHRLVTLQQTTGTGASAGTVTCALWEGPTGTTPAAYSRGSQSREAGYCSGGSNDLAPCNVASECPSGSCSLADVVAAKSVILGTSDTQTGATQYQIDWASVYDGTAMPNGYMETLDLSGTTTADANTNWTTTGTAHSCGASGSQFQCLKDTTAPDENSSALENNNAAKPTIALQFANPATPSASPTPKAVVLEMMAQDTAPSTNGITVDLEIFDGSSTSSVYTPFGFDGFTGAGSTSDPYYLVPQSLWEQSWTVTKLNALEAAINKTAGGGDNGRLSSLVAEVLYQTADPVVPITIPDRDQDGETTVCFVSDSKWDNIDFKNALSAGLVQPTNIYFYTRGSAKLGDVSAEYDQLLEGVAGTFLGLEVFRGSAGRTCDIVLLEMISTAAHGGYSTVDMKSPTSLLGRNQAGWCEDQGGTNQGAACYCDGRMSEFWTSQVFSTPAPHVTPSNFRCINAGAFRASCGLYCSCTTNADCTYGMATPGPLHTPGICSGGICISGNLGPATNGASVLNPPSQRDHLCQAGCINAPGCPNGVCMHSFSPLAYRQGIEEIFAATATRPTPVATPPVGGPPLVVLVTAPQASMGPNAYSGWEQSYPNMDAFRGVYLNYAKEHSTPFVDLWPVFHMNCPSRSCAVANGCTSSEDGVLCYRDLGHWTYRGQVLLAAQTLIDFLTQAGGVTHDGVCTSSVCRSGRVGDTCSADADCDVWRW